MMLRRATHFKSFLLLLLAGGNGLRADPPPWKYSTSWIGNTFAAPKWVQKDGLGLAVGSDGSCYLGSSWDEAGKGAGIYRNGDTVGQLADIRVCEGAVAVDDHFVFLGAVSRDSGAPINGLRRWHRDGSLAPWNGGTDFLPIGTAWQSGACLSQKQLFVADVDTNTIRVFDEQTLQEKRPFACPRPFRLTADHAGRLWVIQREDSTAQGVPAVVVEYTRTGTPTGRKIAADGATALAVSPAGLLLVAGPNLQVLEYDVSGFAPRMVGTLEVKGGVYAGTPGVMAPDKLMGLFGVGTDAAGNIYTLGRAPAEGGGVDLREFSPAGKMLWQLVSTQFADCADVDPATDGVDVYTRDEHFVMDYGKPVGRQWTWKGYTLNPKYDDGRVDPRMGGFSWASPMIRRLQGRLYLFLHPGSAIGIFRKGPGETFIPAGLVDIGPGWAKKAGDDRVAWPPQQPQKSRWLWRDENGDGRIQPAEFQSRPDLIDEFTVSGSWVDTRGGLWLCGVGPSEPVHFGRCLWHLPLQGFDAHQNPIYDLASLKRLPVPDEFGHNGVERIIYQPETDTMYLSGETPEHPKEVHWGSVGTEILRYDHWSKPDRTVRWRIVLPFDPKNDDTFFPALCVAGSRLFAMQRCLSHVHVYDTANGRELGVLTPGPEIGGMTGWCDMENGIQAVQRKNGEYVLFAEDDYRPKIVVYRLR